MIDNIHLQQTGNPRMPADKASITQPGQIEAWPQAIHAALGPIAVITPDPMTSPKNLTSKNLTDTKGDIPKSINALIKFVTKSVQNPNVAPPIDTQTAKKKHATGEAVVLSASTTEATPGYVKPAPTKTKNSTHIDALVTIPSNNIPANPPTSPIDQPQSMTNASIQGNANITSHMGHEGVAGSVVEINAIAKNLAPVTDKQAAPVVFTPPDTKIIISGKHVSSFIITPAGSMLNVQAPVNSTNAAVPSVSADRAPMLVPATGAGLASAITAMHQAGESSAVLRLSPPGLGSLSVHVAIGQNALVNVTFISAVPQTVQILHNNLDDLRQAMAASGLNLGQADVGSDSHQGSFSEPSAAQPLLTGVTSPVSVATPITVTGLRAIA